MNIKLYTPHNKQRLIHKAIEDETTTFITVIAGRQSGKTFAAEQAAVKYAGSKPNALVFWCSPTYNQSKKVYSEIINGFAEAPFIKSYVGGAGCQIEFTNGSKILFRSAGQGDSLRGQSGVDLMIIDESRDIDKTFIDEVLLAMCNTAKRPKIVFTTTPRGKDFNYDNYMLGMDPSVTTHKSITFNYKDNTKSNKAFIEIVKTNMPDKIFRQEYLAEFIEGANLFNISEHKFFKEILGPTPSRKYFFGIDVALADGDYCVISIMDDQGKMVAMKRFNDVTSPQLKAIILEVIKKWKPKYIYIEQNGLGRPITDDLKHEHKVSNMFGFTTTNQSKREVIENLIVAIEQEKIQLLDDTTLKNEFNTMEMTITKSGAVTYKARGSFHDDIPMSVALAYECYQKKKNRGVSSFTSLN